jgi:hypothetical protein
MHFRGTRPLEVLLLPTELHPQTGPVWTGLVIARFPAQVKWYMAFSRGENSSSSHRWNCSSSKQQLKSELDLARRVCIGGVQKAGGHAILGRSDIDSNSFIRLNYPVAGVDAASEAKVSGGVVGSQERVAGLAGKAVVACCHHRDWHHRSRLRLLASRCPLRPPRMLSSC